MEQSRFARLISIAITNTRRLLMLESNRQPQQDRFAIAELKSELQDLENAARDASLLTGQIMIAAWPGKEPKIVEVLRRNVGGYFVREANSEMITGCRTDHLLPYEKKVFDVLRHDYQVQYYKEQLSRLQDESIENS